MSRDIPGFYYDEARGRYFRIEPDHRVVPSNLLSGSDSTQKSNSQQTYSRSSVRRREHQERKNDHSVTWAERIRAETTRKSKLLRDGRVDTEILLDRRLGERRARRGQGDSLSEDVARSWAASLRQRHLWISERFGPSFVINKRNWTIVVGSVHSDPYSGARSNHNESGSAEDQDGYGSRWRIAFAHMPPGSMNGNVLPMTIFDQGEGNVAGLTTISTRSASQIPNGHRVTLWNLEDFGPDERHVFDLARTFNDLHATSMSNRSRSMIACATSEGVLVVSPAVDFGQWELGHLARKEQMAVRWGSEGAKIIFSGDRSGKVILTDLRTNTSWNSASVLRLGHSSAVRAIRQLDQNLVLIHGLSSTAIYDLRYAKPPRIFPRASSTSGAIARRHFIPTSPFLLFAVPDDRRSDRYGCGFAYDEEMNIVAAASSNDVQGHHVTLYSASTGRVIPGYGPLVQKHFNDQVTCLEFARIRDGPKSLVSKSGEFIDEWTPMYSRNRIREDWETQDRCPSPDDWPSHYTFQPR